ncbi:serine protease nudel-like [Branchiostoma floridae]|uniref:Serine protease nudel-like n=1 Tax=Branchiostoma floridae TaxID=7739 RepID=A0A9J7HU17_BRAFL|nr:serine protease nudel-like [Branchiostoma floridae]
MASQLCYSVVLLALVVALTVVWPASAVKPKGWRGTKAGCSASEYACTDGACVPVGARCDGSVECADGSDEEDCTYDCEKEFQCGNGLCKPTSWVCDREDDCGDNTDETNCTCSSEFQRACGDGSCYHVIHHCDGRRDCKDGSDEDNCLPASGCGLRNMTLTSGQSRIVGGDTANRGAWPWQVQLKRTYFNTPFCGGTLVAPEWVVTAAHCLDEDQPNEWPTLQILIGKHHLQHPEVADPDAIVSSVQKVYLHEGYDDYTSDNDIALVRLKTSTDQTNSFINYACLETNETARFDENSYCFTTGWGDTSSGGTPPDLLQELKVALIPTAVCNRTISNQGGMTDNMFCAGYWEGGGDSCQGDSGGPVVCAGADGRWYLTGVTSWGYGCANRYQPGVKTKVSNYIDWLDNKILTGGQVACSENTTVTCGDGSCFPADYRCDGYEDCSDGADEIGCPTLGPPCALYCNNNTKCIPDQWLCDYYADCDDLSDEQNCDCNDAFTCDNGICVLPEYRCDGINHCGDGSDESYCSTAAPIATSSATTTETTPMDLTTEATTAIPLTPTMPMTTGKDAVSTSKLPASTRAPMAVVEMEVTLSSPTFTADLQDNSTEAFQTLSAQVIAAMNSVYQDYPGFEGVTVQGFRSGSVVADVNVLIDSQEEAEMPLAVASVLQAAVTNGNGVVGDVEVGGVAVRENGKFLNFNTRSKSTVGEAL